MVKRGRIKNKAKKDTKSKNLYTHLLVKVSSVALNSHTLTLTRIFVDIAFQVPLQKN